MVAIIPMMFFGYDTAIYCVSAVICLLIAYKACRLHSYSGKMQHFYLATAFTIIGLALATLTLTTAYTYYTMFIGGDIYFFDMLFNVDDLGYWIYYLASFAAYAMLILMYTPELKGMAAAPLIFFSTRYFEYFNIILFFMMAYVAFRAVTNYFGNKTRSTFLVAAAFVLLASYHALLPFAMFSKVAYVLGHAAHIGGFACLLYMLYTTGKK